MVFEGVALVRRHTFSDVIGCVMSDVPPSKNVVVHTVQFNVSEWRRLCIPVALRCWDVFLSCWEHLLVQ